jgi:[ribosomal protein S18]-alanine N-acetyltransferase
MERNLEFRRLTPGDAEQLGRFLEACAADPGTQRFFFAHPLSREFARHLCETLVTRKDLYHVMVVGRRVAAYSLLRGWDEGYAIPSLGLCVHPQLQGLKLGSLMMAYCLGDAKAAGVRHVRWTVDPKNLACVRGANKFGLLCEELTAERLVFKADLDKLPVEMPEMNWAAIDAWGLQGQEPGCQDAYLPGGNQRVA